MRRTAACWPLLSIGRLLPLGSACLLPLPTCLLCLGSRCAPLVQQRPADHHYHQQRSCEERVRRRPAQVVAKLVQVQRSRFLPSSSTNAAGVVRGSETVLDGDDAAREDEKHGEEVVVAQLLAEQTRREHGIRDQSRGRETAQKRLRRERQRRRHQQLPEQEAGEAEKPQRLLRERRRGVVEFGGGNLLKNKTEGAHESRALLKQDAIHPRSLDRGCRGAHFPSSQCSFLPCT
mmetsp:Transcript_13928/g.34406  ORF Transcript_13928/g.34406 Transcript_13928/m.34406 type:complete len:233 (+) Transcript_13928:544-1242(+)